MSRALVLRTNNMATVLENIKKAVNIGVIVINKGKNGLKNIVNDSAQLLKAQDAFPKIIDEHVNLSDGWPSPASSGYPGSFSYPAPVNIFGFYHTNPENQKTVMISEMTQDDVMIPETIIVPEINKDECEDIKIDEVNEAEKIHIEPDAVRQDDLKALLDIFEYTNQNVSEVENLSSGITKIRFEDYFSGYGKEPAYVRR